MFLQQPLALEKKLLICSAIVVTAEALLPVVGLALAFLE
jgi:hypothetical protein